MLTICFVNGTKICRPHIYILGSIFWALLSCAAPWSNSPTWECLLFYVDELLGRRCKSGCFLFSVIFMSSTETIPWLCWILLKRRLFTINGSNWYCFIFASTRTKMRRSVVWLQNKLVAIWILPLQVRNGASWRRSLEHISSKFSYH